MALDELRAARVGPGWRLVLPGRTPTKGNHRVRAVGGPGNQCLHHRRHFPSAGNMNHFDLGISAPA